MNYVNQRRLNKIRNRCVALFLAGVLPIGAIGMGVGLAIFLSFMLVWYVLGLCWDLWVHEDRYPDRYVRLNADPFLISEKQWYPEDSYPSGKERKS